MSDSLVNVQLSICFHVRELYKRRKAEPTATKAATADDAARLRAPDELPEEAAPAVPAGDDAELAPELLAGGADAALALWGMADKSWGITIGAPEAPRLTEPSSCM